MTTEKKKPHPLANYISSEIHGDIDDIEVYSTQVMDDGVTVYVEGEHAELGEFAAKVQVTLFELVETYDEMEIDDDH